MSETAKSENQSYLEPIICDVKTPIEQRVWGQNYQPHRGSVIIDVKQSNKIKKLILAATLYQKIELPYRFALTAGEIIYEKKHIKCLFKIFNFFAVENRRLGEFALQFVTHCVQIVIVKQ